MIALDIVFAQVLKFRLRDTTLKLTNHIKDERSRNELNRSSQPSEGVQLLSKNWVTMKLGYKVVLALINFIDPLYCMVVNEAL